MNLNELIKVKEDQLETIKLELTALRDLYRLNRMETQIKETKLWREVMMNANEDLDAGTDDIVLATINELVEEFAPGVEAGSEVDDLLSAKIELTPWRVFLRVRHNDDVDAALTQLIQRRRFS